MKKTAFVKTLRKQTIWNAAGKIKILKKKQAKKRIFRHFLKKFDQKLLSFPVHISSNLIYIRRVGGPQTSGGSQNSGGGGMVRPFGSAGGRIPKRGGGGVGVSAPRRLFPKSAGGYKY